MQSRQSIHETSWSIKHAGNLFVRNRYEPRFRYEASIQAVVTVYLWPREFVPPLITSFTMNASRLVVTIKVGQWICTIIESPLPCGDQIIAIRTPI